MKKTFFTLVLLIVSLVVFSQGNSGLGFNYQAVIRGADGFVMKSKDVELKFSLFPGQQATAATWVETHKVKTDDFGTIGVIVGKGTKNSGAVGSFADINFAGVHYWLKIELVEGTTNTLVSYVQLTSVPYAEVAGNASSAPAGSIMPFAGDASKVPFGWLLCDGHEVNRSEYAGLYDVIGTAWGFGDNVSTFNLPDMRGVFLRGVSGDSNRDEDINVRVPLKEGGNGKNNVGSYQGDAMQPIEGYLGFISDFVLRNTPTGPFSKSNPSSPTGIKRGNDDTWFDIHFSSSKVTRTGAETRPKNVYVNYIIKY